jgi:hypothetical protein
VIDISEEKIQPKMNEKPECPCFPISCDGVCPKAATEEENKADSFGSDMDPKQAEPSVDQTVF